MNRALLVLGLGGWVAAHPMGNFSVNHYTLIEAGSGSVRVTYLLDLGEVPAYTVLKEARTPEEQAHVWMRGLEFTSGSQRLEPRLDGAEMKTADGSGGLKTARYTMRMTIEGAGGSLQFEDHNFPERAGWKEIVIRAAAGSAIVDASQADTGRSNELTRYEGDAPQDLRAMVEWRAGGENITPSIVPIEQPKTVVEETTAAPPAAP